MVVPGRGKSIGFFIALGAGLIGGAVPLLTRKTEVSTAPNAA